MQELRDGKCFFLILDHCSKGFYIDREEIDPKGPFKYFENHVMNIENMDAIEKEYFYIIKKKLELDTNTREEKSAIVIEDSVEIKYHLRYGTPNSQGIIERKMDPSFTLAINCIEGTHNINQEISPY